LVPWQGVVLTGTRRLECRGQEDNLQFIADGRCIPALRENDRENS
jgi:hypothetical protein